MITNEKFEQINRKLKYPSQIIIFGSGKGGERVFKQYSKDNEILAFCDNSIEKQGTFLFEIEVISPDKLEDLKFDQILIASQYSDSIFVQLIKKKIDPDMIKIMKMEQLAGTPQNISILKQTLAFLFLTMSKPFLCIYDTCKRREHMDSCRKS